MKTVEIVVSTTTEAAEIVADFLSAESYGGVLIKDKNDILALQREKKETWDYIDDSLLRDTEGDVLVSGFVEKGKAKAIAAELEKHFSNLKSEITEINFGSLTVKTRAVDDSAWHKVWKKNFRPIKIGGIVICPKWIKYQPSENEKIVLLNSGMAFGTGEHETTAMCIELMQNFDFCGKTVFDVGCGSGILGIAAAKLGAKFSYLSDIDSMAVAASNQNVKINKVGKYTRVENKNLLDGNAEEKADFVLANLTAGLLIVLRDGIKAAAAENCIVIVSGIINTKIDEVTESYTAAGFSLIEKKTKNDWSALAFRLEGEK